MLALTVSSRAEDIVQTLLHSPNQQPRGTKDCRKHYFHGLHRCWDVQRPRTLAFRTRERLCSEHNSSLCGAPGASTRPSVRGHLQQASAPPPLRYSIDTNEQQSESPTKLSGVIPCSLKSFTSCRVRVPISQVSSGAPPHLQGPSAWGERGVGGARCAFPFMLAHFRFHQM